MRVAPTIVETTNFVQSARDAGYKHFASAVAELVDNSIEAGATEINIELTHAGEVAVTDNGCGMSVRELSRCLAFGGSSRFNSRTGFGRFGVGLPFASISFARRVKVISWNRRSRHTAEAFFDLDRAEKGIQITPRVSKKPSCSGTTVVWSNLDRATRFDVHFRGEVASRLAQTFRDQLSGGLIVQIWGDRLRPRDPMMHSTAYHGATSTPWGPPLEFSFRVGNKVHKVSAQFYLLPVVSWQGLSNQEKQTLGIAKGAGVSVLRAGREIDFGWYFTGAKRRENYDDWWRCEVRFDPALDELFGVSNTKQGIRPVPELRDVLARDLEPIARELNREVRRAFVTVTNHRTTKSTRRAADREIFMSPPSAVEAGATSLDYEMVPKAHTESHFFVPQLEGTRLRVEINSDHPFYSSIYAPLSARSSPEGRALLAHFELILLAAARAECKLGHNGLVDVAEFRKEWSRTLAIFLS